jgi:hypothetical protein
LRKSLFGWTRPTPPRRAIGVELEPRWTGLAARNVSLARSQGGSGQALAMHGDARDLGRRLLDTLRSLKHAGCRVVYLDGSFVTAKELPGDFDACWEISGVDPGRLDRELLDFRDRRAAQKARSGGELFPAETAAEPVGITFLDYFQRDRDTGKPKGIIAIDPGAPL